MQTLEVYKYRPLTDFSQLADFECDVPRMDAYIHDNFAQKIHENNCELYGVYDHLEKLVAIFAISPDEMTVLNDSVPAWEIAYLAVRKDCQYRGIGTACVYEIMKMVSDKGCFTLTVEALSITYPPKERYEAVSFYKKCHFKQLSLQEEWSDVVQLYLHFNDAMIAENTIMEYEL